MFNKLKLNEDILKALEIKGFTIPTEIQEKCIPLILEGRDIIGRSKTGTGKTFAFGLPAINIIDTEMKSVQVLAVCPTRELAMQVTDEIRKVTEHKEGCNVVPIYGGANIDRQIKALKNAKIVVGTPGRLMDHLRRKTLKLHNIKIVVLDEADEMLNMGFREDIETILKNAPTQRQIVMFSATMPPAIKAIAKKFMNEPQSVEIGSLNTTLEEINQSFIRVARNAKKSALLELFNRLNPERTIVFCNTKRMVDEIKRFLISKDIKALALHGDMRQSERKKVMNDIKNHKVSVLVATDVAARGIDIIDVEYIINFDLPKDVEWYIHRIGRTGRAGKSGKAISLINTKEQLVLLDEFKKVTKSTINEHIMAQTMDSFYDIKTRSNNNNFSQSNLASSKRTEGSRNDKSREDFIKKDKNKKPYNRVNKYGKRKKYTNSKDKSKRYQEDFSNSKNDINEKKNEYKKKKTKKPNTTQYPKDTERDSNLGSGYKKYYSKKGKIENHYPKRKEKQ